MPYLTPAQLIDGPESLNELSELFDNGYHFKNVDVVFARVFGEDAMKAAAE